MGVWIFKLVSLFLLIQLIQKDRSVKLPVVLVAEALYGLVNSILVPVVE